MGCNAVKRAVIDTSVLYAYLVEDDPLHVKAVKLLDAIEEWVIPTIVVHELVWALRKHLDNIQARALVERVIFNYKSIIVSITLDDIMFALDDTRYYYDLLVLSITKRLGVPLLSLDKKMVRLARKRGLEVLDECNEN